MSAEAERAALSCCLRSEELARRAASDLSPGEFSERQAGYVFRSMTRILDRGGVPDLTLVIADLREAKQLEQAGGVAYIAALDSDWPDLLRFGQYLEAVKRAATRGRVVSTLRDCIGLAADPDTGVEALIQKTIAALRDEATALPGWVLEGIERDVQEALDEAEQQLRPAMPTGFPRIDAAMAGGVRQGEVVLVAGRMGMGKTSFALNVCETMAGGGNPTVLVELEMRRQELIHRSLASNPRVRLSDIREGLLNRFDKERVHKAADDLKMLPLWILDQARASATMSSVLTIARRAKKGVDLRVLCVDSINHLNDDTKRSHERREEVASMARALKLAALELDIAVLLLCQINREPAHTNDRRPHLHHLAEADALAQHADTVWMLHRESYYDKNVDDHTRAELLMRKNRNGETGEFGIKFVGPYVRFEP